MSKGPPNVRAKVLALVLFGLIAYLMDYGPLGIQAIKTVGFVFAGVAVIIWYIAESGPKSPAGRLKGAPRIPPSTVGQLFENDRVLKVGTSAYALLFFLVHSIAHPEHHFKEIGATGIYLLIAPMIALYWWRSRVSDDSEGAA